MPYLISLPAEAAMVRVARMATELLLGDDPRTAGASLIVSEYFTNSLLHSASGEKAGGTIRVSLSPEAEALRIEVEDDGTRRTPEAAPVDDLDGFGRGLMVVDGTAAKWGHDSYPRRGVAWAEL